MNAAAIARHLEDGGLRPVVDPVARVVLAECPSCFAGSTDRDGIWRPLSVIVTDRAVEVICAAGCPSEAVLAAMRADRVDWQALAIETLDIARGLARLVDELVPRQMAHNHLQVAA